MCAVLFAVATLWRHRRSIKRRGKELEALRAYTNGEQEHISQKEWERRAQASLDASLARRRQNGGYHR
jgi:hypothetical protein